MKNLASDLVDFAAVPVFFGIGIQSREAFMVSVDKQSCPCLVLQPFDPHFFLHRFMLCIPDQSEITANYKVIILCELTGYILRCQLFDITAIAVNITCNIDHMI